MFRRLGLLMVSASFQTGLLFLGAMATFQLPGLEPGGRVMLFIGWMVLQYLIGRWAYRRL